VLLPPEVSGSLLETTCTVFVSLYSKIVMLPWLHLFNSNLLILPLDGSASDNHGVSQQKT
jgi:hypothetical protein